MATSRAITRSPAHLAHFMTAVTADSVPDSCVEQTITEYIYYACFAQKGRVMHKIQSRLTLYDSIITTATGVYRVWKRCTVYSRGVSTAGSPSLASRLLLLPPIRRVKIDTVVLRDIL